MIPLVGVSLVIAGVVWLGSMVSRGRDTLIPSNGGEILPCVLLALGRAFVDPF